VTDKDDALDRGAGAGGCAVANQAAAMVEAKLP
jgi:hypothetical protein